MPPSNFPRPGFSTNDARAIALDVYGVTVSARELPSERDQNFLLSEETSKGFVLKISNAAEHKEVLDFQNQAVEWLAQRVPEYLYPRVCATPSGERIAQVKSAAGSVHYVRLLTYLSGVFLADFKPHAPELLRGLGKFFGETDKALEGFSHPAMERDLKWRIDNAIPILDGYLRQAADSEKRRLVEYFLARFDSRVAPALPRLRTSVIHNDGNDHNVLVGGVETLEAAVVGVIDFGDMLRSYTVYELAITAAYAMLHKPDPVAAAAHVVAGYHHVHALTELELEVLFDLIGMRACMSVAIAAKQQRLEPENAYLSVSERPAWELLRRLAGASADLAHYTFRNACFLPACPRTQGVVDWLGNNRDRIGCVLDRELTALKAVVFDMSVGSPDLTAGEDAEAAPLAEALFGKIKQAGADVGVGRYNEARRVYTSESFAIEDDAGRQQRTIHLGIDLFVEAGTRVLAPLDGVVHSFADNCAPLDYGPTIILRHEEDQTVFYSLYGHLTRDSLKNLHAGMPFNKGDRLARIGDIGENGGWPPHLHFQLVTDVLDKRGDFPGVAPAGEREVWLSVCPDPNLVLGIPQGCFPADEMSPEEILDARSDHLGGSLSVSYKEPLKIVRGRAQYLYDDVGREYLDAVNNVPHVGHCHPRVVAAACEQNGVLNTNTRYLHDKLARYARRLSGLFPEPLNVCFFVCSGSEANDLALRMACAHTKSAGVIVVDGAYHGNLSTLIDISPYKFDGPGGAGCPEQVRNVPMPDGYRGVHKSSDRDAGKKYAHHVREAILDLQETGLGMAAFICEPLMGCGGQIVLPEGFLEEAYRHVRDAGAVCVADEVQIGFGRVGSNFWGFETQKVTPDIVTLGKPIGNGHPLAAVVTTPEIAASFDNGMEYFNTYGGNPVSCAVGLAVLDVIEDERLQENAFAVGVRLTSGLTKLMDKHPLIGDVRGMGLFVGVELVLDREKRTPAVRQASYIVERMKDRGVLIGVDGPLRNVLKIKPPMVFTEENADLLVSTLDDILVEDVLKATVSS